MQTQDVSIDPELRGRLWLPDADDPVGGVVLGGGFSVTVAMGLGDWAIGLAEAGFAALAYDHAGFGRSGGEPRQHVDWRRQARDLRTAVAWLDARPEVDGVATWGSSFSGGQGAVVSTLDDRVRAVVAVVPYLGTSIDGDADVLADPPPSEPTAMLVIPEDGVDLPAMLPEPESVDWFGRVAGGGWENRVAVGPVADPGPAMPRVPVPMLVILATEDRIASVDVARSMAAHVPDVRVLELEGDHFVAYSGDALRRAIEATARFLSDAGLRAARPAPGR
jgi:hypothetical protein